MLKSAFAMKKLISFALATSVLLSFTTLISAEDIVKSPAPLIERVQTTKQTSATREGERKEKMDELRKQIVTKFFDNMTERLQAAEDRLNKILERIESRVDKIKSENPTKDLTKVDADIAAVKTQLTNTQTKIDTLKTDFSAMSTSATPKELFKTLKEDIQDVKEDLQAIRKSLSQIIGEIKGLHVGEEKVRKESPKP